MSKSGSSSSSSSVEEVTTAMSATTTGGTGNVENVEPAVFNHQHEVPCVTKDGTTVSVRAGLLRQSKTFLDMWTDLGMDSATEERLQEFVFPIKAISAGTFAKVVDWMHEHVGKPVPEHEQDQETHERKWFTLTDWEKKFFEVGIEELSELIIAGNFLNLQSLYLYGCMQIASQLKDGSAEDIVKLLDLKDDYKEEEKDPIRKKNVWCNY